MSSTNIYMLDEVEENIDLMRNYELIRIIDQKEIANNSSSQLFIPQQKASLNSAPLLNFVRQ